MDYGKIFVNTKQQTTNKNTHEKKNDKIPLLIHSKPCVWKHRFAKTKEFCIHYECLLCNAYNT